MKNRSMIKWAPFSSVISGKLILNELEIKRNKIDKPILSTDQLNSLNELFFENYYSQEIVIIKYYKYGNILNTKGIITKIDKSQKLITIKNQNIHLSQIIAIKKA